MSPSMSVNSSVSGNGVVPSHEASASSVDDVSGSLDERPLDIDNGPWEEAAPVVTEGSLRHYPAQSFFILSEGIPYWLLILNPMHVTRLYVESISVLRANVINSFPLADLLLPRFRALESLIVEKSLPIGADIPPSSIFLLSGSIEYINLRTTYFSHLRTIGLVDRHFVLRRGGPSSHLSWMSVKHSAIGGATNFRTLWCQRNFEPPLVLPGGMKRNISHFLDHSIRGTPCGAAEVTTLGLCILSRCEDRHVYKTHSTRTGYATRCLAPSELGAMFGYPGVSLDPSLVRSHAPLPMDLLDVLYGEVLRGLPSSAIERPDVASRLCFVPSDPAADTPMPGLLRNLPASWAIDTSVDTAVKHDDADANLELWNRRICLVLDGPSRPYDALHRALPTLRQFCSRYASRKVFREFMGYLTCKHSDCFGRYFAERSAHYAVAFDAQAGCYRRVPASHQGGTGSFLASSSYVPYTLVGAPALPFASVIATGRNILHGFCNHYLDAASYMTYPSGSTLIFWRWSAELQRPALLGWPSQVATELPRCMKIKSTSYSEEDRKRLAEKLGKVISRGYIKLVPKSEVESFMEFFAVPKGEDDIRIVYNGTRCGLTPALWAQKFWLPNADTVLRMMHYNYALGDLDAGEMFLNYPLTEDLVSVSGINLTKLKKEICELLDISHVPDELVGVWLRTWMGLRPSPVWASRFFYLMEEFFKGNEREVGNPYYWDTVKVNIMGMEDFNPSMPNVYKWDSVNKRPAADSVSYIDDLRTIGHSANDTWLLGRRIASRIQYLGSQDAARKRRLKNDGPWIGTIFDTKDGKIVKTVTQKKWDKGRGYVEYLVDTLGDDPSALLEYKLLEKMRGYFCHLAMTYPLLFPYLKGFHLLLSSHQKRRNEDGWKISELEWIAELEVKVEKGLLTGDERDNLLHEDQPIPPKHVQAIPRFVSCLKALKEFFAVKVPPSITVRSLHYLLLIYGFVDASKSGFGATIDTGKNVTYRIGVWGKDQQNESSNWREFENLVETLEAEGEKGNLKDAVVIIATDNQVTENAIYKGNSTSEKLYDLIIRLRKLELHHGAYFVITHVSGERMKHQGTDGVSRGRLTEGITLSEAMITFCPWHIAPFTMCDSLADMIKSWLKDHTYEVLEPIDWFGKAHDLCEGENDSNGFWRWKSKAQTFVWNIPSGAANVAVEQLRKARLKRQQSTHIMLIPRLNTMEWLRQLFREADCIIAIPPGVTGWNSNTCFEPLIVAISLPFLTYRPWKLQGTPKLCELQRKLCGMLKEDNVDTGNLLCKFWKDVQKFYSLPQHVVQRMLYFTPKSEVSSEED